LSFVVQAQNDMGNQIKSDTLIIKSIDIDQIIGLKENDKRQQVLLIEFKNKYQKDDNILVEEFQNYYELIIDHPGIDGFTGGAECYKLDKKTGESEMIWHEHPMKLPEFEYKKEKKIKKNE
jgi:hypothetical protein